MSNGEFHSKPLCSSFGSIVLAMVAGGLSLAAIVPTTIQDFHLPGTQIGDVSPGVIVTADNCIACHGAYDAQSEPYSNWHGSLMGQAGRDPLFFAQMATANQDVANVGYYCLRCHVPLSFTTGHAYQPDGSTLDYTDRDGVNCHFCHAMVDPIYRPGISPPEDINVLASLAEVPQFYGDSMFVLDHTGSRRGPRSDSAALHEFVPSPFHQTGEFCGTCHDVGNVCIDRQPNGTYSYNQLDQPTPNPDPHGQFPLERTYTEWKLSAFANGGVDMGGRFGGSGPTTVRSCQDCHMPVVTGKACSFGPVRSDLKRHDFAGATAWVLEIIKQYYAGDPEVDPVALEAGKTKAIDMLQRAASLELRQTAGTLRVRVINESGHKLPTGHIEGRRVWANVRFFDAGDALIREYGHYDAAEAELDEASTRVYEMHVGLSPAAAALTGYPPGVTTHMALADTIEKDTRIPPRGFNQAAYAAAGAPAVGITYADGQYWDDQVFALPAGASRTEVTVNYQTATRHYIEALFHGNTSDAWGQILHDLWLQTDKGPPIPMVTHSLVLGPFRLGDLNCDGVVTVSDIGPFVLALTDSAGYAAQFPGCTVHHADINQDGAATVGDIGPFVSLLTGRGESH